MQMKQRILTVLAFLTLALGASTALAEVKIAVVDVQRAILNSEEAQGKMQQIQDEFKGDQEEIKNLQAAAAEMLERMQKNGDVMSDAEKRKLQRKIESKNEDFVYLRKRLQKRIESRQQELFSGTDQEVQQAIEQIVLAEDYDLVIPRQAALYVADLYDITRKVTEKLNELNKQQQ